MAAGASRPKTAETHDAVRAIPQRPTKWPQEVSRGEGRCAASARLAVPPAVAPLCHTRSDTAVTPMCHGTILPWSSTSKQRCQTLPTARKQQRKEDCEVATLPALARKLAKGASGDGRCQHAGTPSMQSGATSQSYLVHAAPISRRCSTPPLLPLCCTEYLDRNAATLSVGWDGADQCAGPMC